MPLLPANTDRHSYLGTVDKHTDKHTDTQSDTKTERQICAAHMGPHMQRRKPNDSSYLKKSSGRKEQAYKLDTHRHKRRRRHKHRHARDRHARDRHARVARDS